MSIISLENNMVKSGVTVSLNGKGLHTCELLACTHPLLNSKASGFCSRVRAEGSRFWYTSLEELEEVPVPDGIPGLRTRVIEFTGKFEPVQWACRAPLPSGKLCPRRDRYKVFICIV
jgi:hypothetical protein